LRLGERQEVGGMLKRGRNRAKEFRHDGTTYRNRRTRAARSMRQQIAAV
jgi:hypothetical protein